MNKTKIVCSIGPASCSVEVLEKMIRAGMDVARFNMSHGTHDSHKKMIEAVKTARKNLGVAVAIMIDTKGPEIRIKQFENGKIFLNEGDKFILTTKDIVGTEKMVAVTYKTLPQILSKGNKILLNDGNIELLVEKTQATQVLCKVVRGGELSNNKSINLPGVKTDMPYLSEQDKSDMLFAKEMEADYLAISFVNSPEDVDITRKYLNSINFKNVKIISKIESEDGVKNYDKILKHSDGIMVARGDLGVEIDFVKIPILQKQFISKANHEGKFVITATQMLESMIKNSYPTRAEISDVANSIFDGTTATMLSGETASGDHPAESVETMKRIALEAENYTEGSNSVIKTKSTAKSIGYAAYATSQTKNVKAIVVLTKTGKTAEEISKFRPSIPIIACTPSEQTFHKLSMFYGIVPVLDKSYTDIHEANKNAIKKALSTNLVKCGDKIVLVSGQKAGRCGNNIIAIKKI